MTTEETMKKAREMEHAESVLDTLIQDSFYSDPHPEVRDVVHKMYNVQMELQDALKKAYSDYKFVNF
jgi:hypothetical protein